MTETQDIIGIDQAATVLGMSEKSIRRHLKEIPHRRIDRELRRAVTERKAAKAKGYWPVVQGCDRVIETLRRLQVTAPTQKAVGMVADGRER